MEKLSILQRDIEDYEPLWKSVHQKHYPSKQDTFAIISQKYLPPKMKNITSKSFFIQNRSYAEAEKSARGTGRNEGDKRKINYQISQELVNRKPEGLYAWGGPGGGKTYFMGLMFDLLNVENKMRMNFHEFMSKVHQNMYILEKVE